MIDNDCDEYNDDGNGYDMDVNDDDNSDDNLNNDTPEARLSLLSQGGSLGASGPSDSRLSCS